MKSMDKLTTGIAYSTSAGSAGYWFLQLLDKVTPSQWAAIGVLGSLVFGMLTYLTNLYFKIKEDRRKAARGGFAPIFPDTCYHLTHHWPTAADIPVASDNPAHYADAIRYNARTPLQGSLLPLTRLVWA